MSTVKQVIESNNEAKILELASTGMGAYSIANEVGCTRAQVNEAMRSYTQQSLLKAGQSEQPRDQRTGVNVQAPSNQGGSGEQPRGQPQSSSGQEPSLTPNVDDVADKQTIEKSTSVDIELLHFRE